MIMFKEISDVSNYYFTETLRVYIENFPEFERKPLSVLQEKIINGLFRLYVGSLKEQVVSMALIQSIQNTSYVLLAYIAIDRKYQGKGIGSRFIKYLLRVIKEQSLGKYLLMEVENPQFGEKRVEKEKRVRFYKKLGAKELKDVKYYFPDQPETGLIEMILMVFLESDTDKLEGDFVKNLIKKIYLELYEQEPDNTLLQKIFESISKEVRLI